MASQRSLKSSQAAAISSSSAAGLLGASAQSRANDAGLTPRWRVLSSWTFSYEGGADQAAGGGDVG